MIERFRSLRLRVEFMDNVREGVQMIRIKLRFW